MANADVRARVRKIVSEHLGIDEAELKDDASFVEDLGADSLDNVELVMGLEDEFEAEINDEDAEKLLTVQDVINYISNHVAEASKG